MSATSDRLTNPNRAATPGFLGLHSRRRGTAALSAALPPPLHIDVKCHKLKEDAITGQSATLSGDHATQQSCHVHHPAAVRRMTHHRPGAASARMEDLDGRVAGYWCVGGTEQCLQWAETAADRTTARTGCGTRNRNRPSASRASAVRARIPVANSTGISTTSPNTAAVVASACTATTVGTSKETVDHGRGVAVTSLLAVVSRCCSTKCWYQRSRTSRAAAVAFGYTFGDTAVFKPRSA